MDSSSRNTSVSHLHTKERDDECTDALSSDFLDDSQIFTGSIEENEDANRQILDSDILSSSNHTQSFVDFKDSDSCENLSREAFSIADVSVENIFNDDLICDKDCSDISSKRHRSSSSMIEHTDQKVFSGFTNAKNQEIFIDKSKLDQAQCELFNPVEENQIPPKLIEELMSSLSEHPKDADFIFDQGCSSEQTELLERFSQSDARIDSGFVTGKNERVLVSAHKVDEWANDHFKLESFTEDNKEPKVEIPGQSEQEELVETGFTTGKLKSVLVTKKSLVTMQEASRIENGGFSIESSNNTQCEGSFKSTYEKIDRKGIAGIEEKFKNILESDPNSVNKSQEAVINPTIHSSENSTEMAEIYKKVCLIFKNQEQEWIFQQFKWTWLHLFVNGSIERNSLFEEVEETMKLRLKYEKSILRKIVEFDDVPFRFMVLGIIDFTEKSIELFDGFYSVKAQIDKSIYTMLKHNNCTLGSKLFVFGSTLLLKEPTSIFDVQDCVLKLHYNSVKVCRNDEKLGRAGKVAFLNQISSILADGGAVSGLIVRIKKILETKYLVSVENYKNRVEDLESEFEKIFEIAAKIGHEIRVEDISVRPYCKMIIEDRSGECMLTWWSPPEIKENEQYKFVFLNTVDNFTGLHLSTTKKTYFEKVFTNKKDVL